METHWPDVPCVSPTKRNKTTSWIRRLAGSSLFQTETLRAGVQPYASTCSQFVRILHRVSMQFEGSLVGT